MKEGEEGDGTIQRDRFGAAITALRIFGAGMIRCRDHSAQGRLSARDDSAQFHFFSTINTRLEYKAVKLLRRLRV